MIVMDGWNRTGIGGSNREEREDGMREGAERETAKGKGKVASYDRIEKEFY